MAGGGGIAAGLSCLPAEASLTDGRVRRVGVLVAVGIRFCLDRERWRSPGTSCPGASGGGAEGGGDSGTGLVDSDRWISVYEQSLS